MKKKEIYNKLKNIDFVKIKLQLSIIIFFKLDTTIIFIILACLKYFLAMMMIRINWRFFTAIFTLI